MRVTKGSNSKYRWSNPFNTGLQSAVILAVLDNQKTAKKKDCIKVVLGLEGPDGGHEAKATLLTSWPEKVEEFFRGIGATPRADAVRQLIESEDEDAQVELGDISTLAGKDIWVLVVAGGDKGQFSNIDGWYLTEKEGLDDGAIPVGQTALSGGTTTGETLSSVADDDDIPF
jgi:hypothetical protein